jgi:hypothetical protein
VRAVCVQDEEQKMWAEFARIRRGRVSASENVKWRQCCRRGSTWTVPLWRLLLQIRITFIISSRIYFRNRQLDTFVLYLYVMLTVISLVLRTVCAVTVCILYKGIRRSSQVPGREDAAGFRTLRRAERDISS